MSTLDEITKRVTDMPMLSFVMTRLMEVIGQEDHSQDDVVKIVENDASLIARVLKVANSALYFRGNTISTVKRAIGHLGIRAVFDIAVSSCSQGLLNRALVGYESAATDMWNHSLCTAIASREVTVLAGNGSSAELAFTAGLLHDIGKSIISDFLEGNTEKLAAWCDQGVVNDYLQGEKDLLGTDHAIVGHAIARHWKLPEVLCAVIQSHHHPQETDDEFRQLVYMIHLGDMLAMLCGTGTGADTLAYKVDEGYQEYVPIDKQTLSELIFSVQEKFLITKQSVLASEEV